MRKVEGRQGGEDRAKRKTLGQQAVDICQPLSLNVPLQTVATMVKGVNCSFSLIKRLANSKIVISLRPLSIENECVSIGLSNRGSRTTAKVQCEAPGVSYINGGQINAGQLTRGPLQPGGLIMASCFLSGPMYDIK